MLLFAVVKRVGVSCILFNFIITCYVWSLPYFNSHFLNKTKFKKIIFRIKQNNSLVFRYILRVFSFNVQRPFNEVLSLFYTKSPLSIKRLIGCFLRGSLHYQTTLLTKTGNTQLQQKIEIFCSSSFLDKDLNPNNKKAFLYGTLFRYFF